MPSTIRALVFGPNVPVLGVVFLMVIWTGAFVWLSPWPSYPREPQNAVCNYQADADSTAPHLSASQKAPADNCNDESAESSIRDWWLVRFAGYGVLVAIGQMIMFFLQLNAMRAGVIDAGVAARAAESQALVAAKNLSATFRPWVSIHGFRALKVSFDSVNEGIRVTVQLHLKNSGRTPALRTDVGIKVQDMMLAFPRLTELQDELAAQGLRMATAGANTFMDGYPVFPEAQPHLLEMTSSITKKDIEDRKAILGKSGMAPDFDFFYPMVLCCVTYIDPSDGAPHQTQMALQVSMAGSVGQGIRLSEMPFETHQIQLSAMPFSNRVT